MFILHLYENHDFTLKNTPFTMSLGHHFLICDRTFTVSISQGFRKLLYVKSLMLGDPVSSPFILYPPIVQKFLKSHVENLDQAHGISLHLIPAELCLQD